MSLKGLNIEEQDYFKNKFVNFVDENNKFIISLKEKLSLLTNEEKSCKDTITNVLKEKFK